MTVSGGTPVSISFAGIEFVFTGDAKPEFDDGINVTLEANANGTNRELYEIGPWMVSGCTVECTYDQWVTLNDIKNTVGGKDVSIELATGEVIVAPSKGKPVGTIKYDSTRAVASFDVGGGRDGRLRAGLKKV